MCARTKMLMVCRRDKMIPKLTSQRSRRWCVVPEKSRFVLGVTRRRRGPYLKKKEDYPRSQAMR
jgi:hypothetical protein